MNGVGLIPLGRIVDENYLQILPGGRGCRCKSIMVRPSISKGRGYAVVVKRDENEEIIIQPAPRTAKLTRIGRFHSFPKEATITDLPDNLLQNIFSYISDPKTVLRCATVSKRWRNIINSVYVKKPPLSDRSISRGRISHPMVQALETAKLKIFGGQKTGQAFIETASQRKEDASFREVVIRIDMDGSSDGNQLLLNYLIRLATYLTPTQAFLLANIELTDALITFLFTVWQPKFIELRLLRCSLDGISATSLEILMKSERLRHLYLDECSMLPTCPLAMSTSLVQLAQSMTRLELCFRLDESVASLIDNRFLELLSDGWKTRSSIRWLKLRAPLITADGIETLIGRYFKLRFGESFRDSGKRGYTKVPKLLMWLSETSVDVDDLLSRRSGRKWFREEKLPTSIRRRIYDAYSGGEDLTIWVENTQTK